MRKRLTYVTLNNLKSGLRSASVYCEMNRYYSYLNTATVILGGYKGQEPFSTFLKKYFSQHKKYGSKDRKHISHLCYCYFRLGKAFADVPTDTRIILGLFFTSHAPVEMLATLQPDLNEYAGKTSLEKFALLKEGANALPGLKNDTEISDVFPWKEELGSEVELVKWNESFFIQPDLFLRLRPGKERMTVAKLESATIPYTLKSTNCVAIANSSTIDSIIELDTEAVIQDYNSQRVGELMGLVEKTTIQPWKIWDCCAASGGKSILAFDILKDINLTVSDIRESIIVNLKRRLQRAGIYNYNAFTGDLTNPLFNFPNSRGGRSNTPAFDLVICDAPCTGSGTWSRTPEQLYYFNPASIEKYAALQKKIVSTATRYLHPNGYFLYITCSVFKKENEEVVQFIQQNSSLELIKMKVLPGYEEKADTMFAAIFRKSATGKL